jgi:hypothetical protein
MYLFNITMIKLYSQQRIWVKRQFFKVAYRLYPFPVKKYMAEFTYHSHLLYLNNLCTILILQPAKFLRGNTSNSLMTNILVFKLHLYPVKVFLFSYNWTKSLN